MSPLLELGNLVMLEARSHSCEKGRLPRDKMWILGSGTEPPREADVLPCGACHVADDRRGKRWSVLS